jgi:NADPH-dependent ferric siderophore reductase
VTTTGGGDVRTRREPPAFRPVTVAAVSELGARLRRVRLTGTSLVDFPVPLPAASVRLLLPAAGTDEVVMPAWNGNEFLLPDGRRPILRTLTPRRVDPAAGAVDVDVVVHGHGPLSEWASTCTPGSPTAVSGPGRGYSIDPAARAFLLVGDETALAAIAQLLEAIPPSAKVHVHVEVAQPEGRVPLPSGAAVAWHDLDGHAPPGETLVDAVRHAAIDPDTRIWVAGEAAAVQRIRKQLFETRGVKRADATVRGYWKHGRSGDVGDD